MPAIPPTQEAQAGEMLEALKVEVAVSRDCATALQPGRLLGGEKSRDGDPGLRAKQNPSPKALTVTQKDIF